VTGRVWKGSAFGGARGRTDVPKLVDWYMDKQDRDRLADHAQAAARADQRGVRPDARGHLDPRRRRVLNAARARGECTSAGGATPSDGACPRDASLGTCTMCEGLMPDLHACATLVFTASDRMPDAAAAPGEVREVQGHLHRTVTRG
jgi:hypothetical protein